MRTFLNLFRAISILAIGGLIGYYDFQTNGYMGAITNVVYFTIGILLVTTWKSPESKQSEADFDAQFLSVRDIDVNAVEQQEETVKEVENMPRFTLEEGTTR